MNIIPGYTKEVKKAPLGGTNGDARPRKPIAAVRKGRHIVVTGADLEALASSALDHLREANTPHRIFLRNGEPVAVRELEPGHVSVDSLTPDLLYYILEQATQFLSVGRDGQLRPIAPPSPVVRYLLAFRPWPGFPPLRGVVRTPPLRPDGTVAEEAGYDPETGLYYVPDPAAPIPPVPPSPTAADVEAALVWIGEAVGEFPFVDDSSRANALALLLTAVIRPAIPGPVPLGVITAPSPGTGKTLLARVIAMVASSRDAGIVAETADDEEMRKRVTSALIAGSPVIVLDNVARPLRSPVLAAAITAGTWEDRLLGSNTSARLPNTAVWIATGNNVRLAGDLPRRVVLIELDARSARPWERTSFRHPDLLDWVLVNRGRILWACLVLWRHWHAAGCPLVPGPAMGGFEGWAKRVGGILACAGIEGMLGNTHYLHEVLAESHAGWEAFLRAWLDEIGDAEVTVAELTDRLRQPGPLRDSLPDDLLNVIVGERVDTRRLGIALKKRRGVRFSDDDGLRLELGSDDGHVKRRRWRVRTDPPPPAPAPGIEHPADDGRRVYVYALASGLGFPRVSLDSTRAVAGQEEWRAFAERAPEEDIDRAIGVLRAISGEDP